METAGKKGGLVLPSVGAMMLMITGGVIVVSVVCAAFGAQVTSPVNGEVIAVRSLLSAEVLGQVLRNFIRIVTDFPILPLVLLLAIATGVAEQSGFLDAFVRFLMRLAPRRMLTPAVLLGGTIAGLMSDAAYIIIVPLGAIIFKDAGRHPVAGLCATFAAVGASGSFVVRPGDAVILSVTEAAARTIDPAYTVSVVGYYWFQIAFAAIAILIYWAVTALVVEPMLGRWTGATAQDDACPGTGDRRPLVAGSAALLICVAGAIAASSIPGGPLYRAEGGGLVSAMAAIVFISLMAGGIANGIAAGRVRRLDDIVAMMDRTAREMGGLIILLLVAAYLNAFIAESKLGVVTAVAIADLIRSLGGGAVAALLFAILLPFLMDVIMPGATPKWVILAPVLVPSLMLLGWSPEMTTAAFRIGDAPVNIINPLMVFFPMTLVVAQRYLPGLGIDGFLKIMLCYAAPMAVIMTLVTLAWALAGLAPGPGAPAFYPPP